MNYNIEDLFKQKMLNHTTVVPQSLWSGIRKQLVKPYKYIAVFSVIIAFVAGAVFISTNNINTLTYEKPIPSTTEVNNLKSVVNIDTNYFIVDNSQNSQQSYTTVISGTTPSYDVDLNPDTNIVLTQFNDNITITDTVTDYQGFTISETRGCSPLTIVLESLEYSKDLTWKINDLQINDTGIVVLTLIEPDDYEIILNRNDNGHINTFVENVVVDEMPVADFSVNNKVVVNEDILFENLSFDASKYSWYVNSLYVSSAENAVYKFRRAGEYKIILIVANDLDCSDTIIKNIEVIEPTQSIVCPTAFSPNMFGSTGGYYSSTTNENEVFHPFIFGKEIAEYSMKIFNKQGELLFQSTDFQIGWDGYFFNKLVPVGVYIYSISGSFTDGEIFNEQGSVTVIYDN